MENESDSESKYFRKILLCLLTYFSENLNFLKNRTCIFDRETRSIAVLETLKLGLGLLGQTLLEKLQKVFLIVFYKGATCKQFLFQSF